MILRALLLWLALALPSLAQGLPAPLSLHLSDYADAIPAQDEADLTAMLEALRADPGVEVAVAVIRSRADLGPWGAIEPLAKALFNTWGIGHATRNDGILVLVAVEDREVRVALGAGYPPVWDGRAQRVIEVFMLPLFDEDDIAGGLRAGLRGLESYLIRPFAEGLSYEETRDPPGIWGGKGWVDFLIITGFFCAAAAMWLVEARARLGDMIAARRPCPSCGGRGIVIETEIAREPGEETPGLRHVRRQCPRCGWHRDRDEPLPTLSEQRAHGGEGFGGGQSSGGGATGRW